MPSNAEQAIIDLRSKIALERKLRPELQKLNRKIVRDYVRGIGTQTNFQPAQVHDEALATILNEHYDRARIEFSKRINKELPVEVKATDAEEAEIAAALAIFFSERSQQQTRFINDTTQKNMEAAFTDAVFLSQEQAMAEERQVTPQELALTAGSLLSLKLAGRVEGVVSTETQAASETSKDTEATVLSGIGAAVAITTARDVPVTKEWITVGDELVRPAHNNADNQIQQVGGSYIVGGQSLRWPGDTGQGATLNNVMNCRCASIHDVDEILSVRLQPGFAPFTET